MGHIVFNFSILICLLAVCFILYKHIEDFSGIDHLLFAGMFLVLWVLCYIFYYYEPRRNMALYWYLIQCFSKSIFFVTLWIFSIVTTSPFVKIRKQVYITFYIIPIFTALFAATNDTGGMMFTHMDIVKIYPVKQMEVVRGLWYYVDFFYNFFSLSIPIVIFGRYIKRVPANFKYQYITYAISFGAIILFQILDITIDLYDYDLALFGSVLGFLIIYWNMFHYKYSDLLMFAKDTIFQKITCVCLVTEKNGKILDSNPEAKKLFSFVHKKLEDATYDELRKKLVEHKHASFRENESGEILTMYEDGKQMFFQIQKSPIKDKNGEIIGDFIEIRDTTAQQELILELYKQANFDQLTKLYNRRYFEMMCEKMDNEEYYPLSVISGDLNGLKYTNDNFGHAAGDILIVRISDILREAAPENAVIARPGGDEFQILLPRTNEFAVKQFINKVEYLCGISYEKPFGYPSISLGYSIKTNENERMEDIINEADSYMYMTKRERKRKNGDDLKADPRLNF